MRLSIPKDYFNNDPTPPRVFLCTTGKKRMYELPATNRQLNGKWSTYSEFSFEMQHTYIDVLTGETKVHPAYDKLEVPRNILVENYGYWCLQDIDDSSGDNDIKSVTAFSLEYATSNKYLTNWHINTGEVDSKEVLYNEAEYGVDYNTDMDSFYKLAAGAFDPYESYYQQVYTNTNDYIYEQVQIKDDGEYQSYLNNNNNPNAQPHQKLYMKRFANVQFYNPNKQGLSLLHLIFTNIPDWKIGNVDQSLWRKERQFSESRISIYDFIQNNICDTFGCVVVWDSLSGLVHFYEELEDDSDVNNEATTRFKTDVFIDKDNLASQINIKYSSDNIKTKLVVTGSDNLDIREVNLGRNEIMDLSFYHTLDWMEPDLYEAYSRYLANLQEAETGLDKYGLPSEIYPMSYPDAMKGWVSANNHWSDLMNEVPAEGNVVLVGDEFKKLYCTYRAISNAYYQGTINSGTVYIDPNQLYSNESFTKKIPTPTNSEMYVVQGYHLVYNNDEKVRKFEVKDEWESKEMALIKHLNLYHVYEDFEANKQDNILLKLKNSASDVATIRIYDKRKRAYEYDERLKYYTKDKDGKFSSTPVTFSDAIDFNQKMAEYASKNTTIWTNDYYIQSVVVKASSGVSEAPDQYSIMRWIKDELTAEEMNLAGYKITYIGTMGAYFVLAKDESVPENLQDYGVNMLEEKHKTYTTLFQAQTEAMLSQEKAQCIAQDIEPEGDYADGTRWLDTDNNPIVLKEYRNGVWNTISASLSETEQTNYENYQRYIDNYNKLKAIQQVLSVKQLEADYLRDGYMIPDRVITLSSTDGYSLEEKMYDLARSYFSGHTITRKSLNSVLPLYTFTTSFDPIVYGKNTKEYNAYEQYYIKDDLMNFYTPVAIKDKEEFDKYDKTLYVVQSGHIFAIYLKGTTPYVAYANSQGVYQMIMEYIRDKTDMNNSFTLDQWTRLSPFIKEDEFNDSNFLLTGYESEEERLKICQELMDAAAKELKTLCKPSLDFSMTMANILSLPEFEPLLDQFQLGNFITVGIREGYLKRARLLEVNMNFDDFSSFDCTFGNLVTTKSEIDKHADLLKTAITAGKQVAKSSGSWQKAVDKTNQLEDDIANGLRDAALSVASSSGQSVVWDERGILGRKLVDGTTDQYEPEQFMLTNNKLVFTNSNWESSKGVFGNFMVNGENRWGVLADAIVAGYIESPIIKGGTIEIGEGDTKFVVNPDGSVEIRSDGTNYLDAMKEIDEAYKLRIELEYDGSTIFTEPGQSSVITCKVFYSGQEITTFPTGTQFKWTRISNENDDEWNQSHTYIDINTITITNEDIKKNAQFHCQCTIDETKLS